MFEDLIAPIREFNQISDQGLDAIKDQIEDIIGALYNPSDMYKYIASILQEARDYGMTYDEYQNIITNMRDELNKTKEIIKEECTSEIKSQFINRLIDPIIQAVDVAEGSIDFFHVHIDVQKVHPDAIIPTYAHPWDAGADVYAVEDTTLYVGDTKIIPTGLKMNVPRGWMVSVRPRSGLSVKTGLRVANAPGTIDTGYLDEVGIIMSNCGDQKYDIHKGDRIAQFVVERRWTADFNQVDSVANAEDNRNGGFGSSGQ